jgi:hypothetical protein
MFRKTLIALAATAALATGMAATAEAKTHIDLNIGLGGFGGGYYGGGYGGGYYDDGYYGGDCGWQWVKVKKWNPWVHHFVIKHKKVWTCY